MNQLVPILKRHAGVALILAFSSVATSAKPSVAIDLNGGRVQIDRNIGLPKMTSVAPPPVVSSNEESISAESGFELDSSASAVHDVSGNGTLSLSSNVSRSSIETSGKTGSSLGRKKEKQPRIGHNRSSITVDGIKRIYSLHVPKSFAKDKHVPLIIVLHGGLGDGRSAEWDSVMSKQSEKDGFVVAYPNGFLRSWNAGLCCGPARVQKINDLEFMRQLIAKLQTQLGVDADRVYVAGLSNGGMMAYRIASELTDVVAAVSPVEGCMYDLEPTKTAPMSVIAFHGMEDSVVKYNGGIGWVGAYSLKATPVAPTIEYWIKRNKCDATPIREEKGNLIKELYSNGTNGSEVCLYTLKDGGHAWPGGRRASFIFDKPKDYISATEVMCEFFWAHPRRTGLIDADQRRVEAPFAQADSAVDIGLSGKNLSNP